MTWFIKTKIKTQGKKVSKQVERLFQSCMKYDKLVSEYREENAFLMVNQPPQVSVLVNVTKTFLEKLGISQQPQPQPKTSQQINEELIAAGEREYEEKPKGKKSKEQLKKESSERMKALNEKRYGTKKSKDPEEFEVHK